VEGKTARAVHRTGCRGGRRPIRRATAGGWTCRTARFRARTADPRSGRPVGSCRPTDL